MDLIKHIDARHRFRDPIYGYIWLTSNEAKVVDLPIFQRLRRVSQLALTKYVYPTAEHSRFVHSLGVLQSATDIFVQMYRKNKEIFDSLFRDKDVLHYFKVLRYAALLHDVGHLPFSHATEDLFGIEHEAISALLIEKFPEIQEILSEDGIDPVEVSVLLTGEATTEYRLLKLIISGELDADRADYLLRDSYFCGVEYGNYDYDRYISGFRLIKTVNDEIELAIEEGSLQAIEAFLLARYYYNIQVPYHRTRMSYDIALGKYLECLLESESELKGKLNINDFDFRFYELFDDSYVFERAKSDYYLGKNDWSLYMLRKKHLKLVEEATELTESSLDHFVSLQEHLHQSGFVENSDFFIKRVDKAAHTFKEEKVDEERKYSIIDKVGIVKSSLLSASKVLQNFKNCPMQLLRLYVTPEIADSASKIVVELRAKEEQRAEMKKALGRKK